MFLDRLQCAPKEDVSKYIKTIQAVFCYVENERIVALFRRSLDLRHELKALLARCVAPNQDLESRRRSVRILLPEKNDMPARRIGEIYLTS